MKNQPVIDGAGWYWFVAERSSKPSICELIGGRWYPMNEVGPISLGELNRRGWFVFTKVSPVPRERCAGEDEGQSPGEDEGWIL